MSKGFQDHTLKPSNPCGSQTSLEFRVANQSHQATTEGQALFQGSRVRFTRPPSTCPPHTIPNTKEWERTVGLLSVLFDSNYLLVHQPSTLKPAQNSRAVSLPRILPPRADSQFTSPNLQPWSQAAGTRPASQMDGMPRVKAAEEDALLATGENVRKAGVGVLHSSSARAGGRP